MPYKKKLDNKINQKANNKINKKPQLKQLDLKQQGIYSQT